MRFRTLPEDGALAQCWLRGRRRRADGGRAAEQGARSRPRRGASEQGRATKQGATTAKERAPGRGRLWHAGISRRPARRRHEVEVRLQIRSGGANGGSKAHASSCIACASASCRGGASGSP